MAKYEIKFMMDIQLPMPFVASEILRRPYVPICCSLILISSRLVKKEKRGANGNATAKKATNPS